MRLCGVTTRFHRVTKLVSGHTVSSWMGGKRNRVVEGKGGWGRDGEEKSGGRRSWEEWVREREKGEKFGEWRLASGKVELPFRLEGKRYLVVSCSKIVEKGSKKLARVWCSATSDGERVFAIQSGAFRPWNIHARAEMRKRGGRGIDAVEKNNAGWKGRAVKIKLESGGYFEKRN